MPSFIAAAQHCKIDGPTNKPRAAQFGIEVYGYKDGGHYKTDKSDFDSLKDNFDKFCSKNPGQSCNMLMFTGLHGNYENNGNSGFLNNLDKNQLQELVEIAQKHKVQFKHIVADCCCGSFGMSYLQAILANGGEAICDRTTSDGHKMQDMLVDKMIDADPNLPNAEQNLINETIKNTMNTYNCPMYLTKDNKGTIKVLGTTVQESTNNIIQIYRNFGITDEKDNAKAEEELRNYEDIDKALNEIILDCQESSNLFIIQEKDSRDFLLAIRALLESNQKVEKTLKIDKQDISEKVLHTQFFKKNLSDIKEDEIDEEEELNKKSSP